MTLLRSQQNDLFGLIQENGLDPAAFTWTTMPQEWTGWVDSMTPALIYSGGEFCFVIGDSPPSLSYARRPPSTSPLATFAVQYCPGPGVFRHHQNSLTWQQVLAAARDWLASLRRELGAPDLWGALTKEAGTTSLHPLAVAASSTPFSAAEQATMREALGSLRDHISATYELTSDQTSLLSVQVSHLQEATSRVSKKDFILMAGGAFFGWLLAASIPPDSARAIWHSALEVIHGVLSGQYRLP